MDLGEPIAEGNTAKIYISGNKIIKLLSDYLPETESKYEANKQEFAFSCGLPVPKVFEVTKINGKQAIVMEYIRGETLGDIMKKDMIHAEHYMKTSVEIQRKIHSITALALEPMSEKLSRQIKSAHNLDEIHRSALLEILDSIPIGNNLCHGDYHFYNLIQTESDVVVIDWVDSSSGDVRADVYRTYLLYTQFSKELADMYLRLYCEISGFTQNEIFVWAPIIAGARLSENVSSENSQRLLQIVNKYCPL